MGNTIDSCCCACDRDKTDEDEMKTELNRPADLKFVEQTVGIFSSRDNSFELQSVDLSGEEDKENDDENDEQEDPENEVEDILDGLNWFSRLQIQVLSPIE